jgi:hypothetical protein
MYYLGCDQSVALLPFSQRISRCRENSCDQELKEEITFSTATRLMKNKVETVTISEPRKREDMQSMS